MCLACDTTSDLLSRSRYVPIGLYSYSGGVKLGQTLAWHRRHALAIAGQLPDNPADARLVLRAVQELLDNFLDPDETAEEPRAPNVLPFGAAVVG